MAVRALLLAAAALLGAASPARVTIDARYPIGHSFENHFVATEQIRASGDLAKAVKSKTIVDRGTIRITRLPNDGRFLVSKARGTYVERTVLPGGAQTTRPQKLRSTSEFDALGYAKNGAGDPADLIPIFPGKAVAAGAMWRVRSKVKTAYGAGIASYRYRVRSITRAKNGDVLATFSVAMTADFRPNPSLRARSISGTAEGTIVWNSTEHERSSSRTSILYTVRSRAGSLTDLSAEQDFFTPVAP